MYNIIEYGIWIIIILITFIIYYGLNSLVKQLVTREYRNAENRISKTKVYKTISRRNELYNYELPLKPNLEKFNPRFLAKLIDFGFYFLICYTIKNNVETVSFLPFFPSLISLFIINPLLECITGKTIGKFILGLEVIDDTGKKPSFLISYAKNLLQLGILIVFIASYSTFWEEELFFHNKKTLTYTIKTKERKDILSQIKAK